MGRFEKVLRRLWRRPLTLVGFFIVLGMVIMAVFAPQLALHDPVKPDFLAFLQAPSEKYRLGTDELGRDVLSRIIFGARASLQAGLVSVMIALAIGVPVGLISGYYRGVVDEYVVMRLADAMMSFPVIVIALALAAVLGPSLGTAMIAIGIVYTPIFMRLTRGQVLEVRQAEFVQAAHAIGASNATIVWRHIMPNIMAPVLVQASLPVASAILVEAALSFLGLGIQPAYAQLGIDAAARVWLPRSGAVGVVLARVCHFHDGAWHQLARRWAAGHFRAEGQVSIKVVGCGRSGHGRPGGLSSS